MSSEILKALWNTNLNYKGIRVNIFGIPKFLTCSEKSINNELWRLNKKGFIKNKEGKWSITKEGKEYINVKKNKMPQFYSPLIKNSPKKLLFMFDIPELKKSEREWLRSHLIKFEYIMVQKSVWVGPDPLPKDFMQYIKKIGMEEYIKTYKLADPYKIKKSSFIATAKSDD